MYEYDFQSSYIHLYLQFVFDTFFDCYNIESIIFVCIDPSESWELVQTQRFRVRTFENFANQSDAFFEINQSNVDDGEQ